MATRSKQRAAREKMQRNKERVDEINARRAAADARSTHTVPGHVLNDRKGQS